MYMLVLVFLIDVDASLSMTGNTRFNPQVYYRPKTRGLNLVFPVMDNEASTSIKNTRTNMYIKHYLVPQGNHRDKNT